MTNQERWNLYNKDIVSPENYIQWGWISLIAASLQRRVWLSASHLPCYANMYIILVGKPATGKGLVLRSVETHLKYWKREKMTVDKDGKTEQQVAVEQATFDKDTEAAREADAHGLSKKAVVENTLLIPVAPDATTYEALVGAVSRAYRRVNFKRPDGSPGIYGHSSLTFCLPELASLMRKKTEDTINYLLGIYDSPDDYEYDTRTRGREKVRRGCINILAGTTPGFVKSTFESRLIDEGWTSRTFYIFAHRPRFYKFTPDALTQEQLDCSMGILLHIRKLSQLYGEVKISKETKDFLQFWWENSNDPKIPRPNKSTKMEPYYGRKNLHVMKVAMALHFGESLKMEIPISTFERAIKILDREERTMHLALALEGDHPVAKAATRVLTFLESGEKNWVDLYIELAPHADKETLEKAIEFLKETDQVSSKIVDEGMNTPSVYYFLKPIHRIDNTMELENP